MNNITNILNIEDEDIIILGTRIEYDTKYIDIIKVLKPVYCPICGSIKHSKGIYVRSVNHSMLLDGFKLVINLHQRKWVCTNPDCRHYSYDEFSFVRRYKRQTNLLPFMILNALKDYRRTTAEVARMFSVSDTYVHELFMSYINVSRLPLPEILSIDEVFLDIDYKTRYSCVLLDFKSREIVDILPNRWSTTLDAYFFEIPKEERNSVKYIISDMYDVYVEMPIRYFPNAISIIDSFHVISNINNKLLLYINSVKRKYMERDRKELEEKNRKNNTEYKSQKKSKEVNILNHYQHFLLGDVDNMEYVAEPRYNKYLHCYVTDYDIEKYFMSLDENFPILRDLKQEYLKFNSRIYEDRSILENEFDKITNKYENCGNAIFVEFARLLNRYREPILASFTYAEIFDGTISRLSNGPMEGFNRKPKDMKRDARGFEVFEYIKGRLIYSSRSNVPIRAIPKGKDEIKRSNKKYRKQRNKYNKNK